MTAVDIEPQVRTLIARLARIDDDFRADADVFRELGLRSASALDLVLQLEEDFDISIDDDAFATTRTLEQMAALVAHLRGGAACPPGPPGPSRPSIRSSCRSSPRATWPPTSRSRAGTSRPTCGA